MVYDKEQLSPPGRKLFAVQRKYFFSDFVVTLVVESFFFHICGWSFFSHSWVRSFIICGRFTDFVYTNLGHKPSRSKALTREGVLTKGAFVPRGFDQRGFWPEGFWPEGFWPEDFWPKGLLDITLFTHMWLCCICRFYYIGGFNTRKTRVRVHCMYLSTSWFCSKVYSCISHC